MSAFHFLHFLLQEINLNLHVRHFFFYVFYVGMVSYNVGTLGEIADSWISKKSDLNCSYLSIPNPTYSSRFQRVSVPKRLVYNVFASPNPYYSLLHDVQRHKYMQT